MMVLFKNECSFSGGDNHMWWEHSNTLQKIELYALSGSGTSDPHAPGASLTLAPIASHLVKLFKSSPLDWSGM